jgi:hypothetical protein
MRTFMPAIVLPNIGNKCVNRFPATKFGDAPSNRCANRRLAGVHQKIRPRSRPSLGQAARGLREHAGDAQGNRRRGIIRMPQEAVHAALRAVFMFVEEPVGKKLRPPFSLGSCPAWSGRMCRPTGLRNKAFICSDRSPIGALHVRDEYRAAVRTCICLTDVIADRLLSPVMSCDITSQS